MDILEVSLLFICLIDLRTAQQLRVNARSSATWIQSMFSIVSTYNVFLS